MADGDIDVAPGVRIPAAALRETFVRSGGPGGQNVNKVASQVQLRLAVGALDCSDALRDRVRRNAPMTRAGEIVVRATEHRSQAQNRAAAVARLVTVLRDALHEDPTRVATRPSRSARERRLHAKARGAMTKSLRRRPGADD
jgi:ribosome-associated protein